MVSLQKIIADFDYWKTYRNYQNDTLFNLKQTFIVVHIDYCHLHMKGNLKIL